MINFDSRSKLIAEGRSVDKTVSSLKPELLDQWFPVQQQQHYVSQWMGIGRVGLTKRRAECLVQLWAYLFLKQQFQLGQMPKASLTALGSLEGLVPCTHREAAELFYSKTERGSDRAAGMMIDRLAALGLIEKKFDGHTICIGIRPLPSPPPPKDPSLPEVLPDAFNPRTDTIPIASLLARNYSWMDKDPSAIAPQKIAKILRCWAQQYPKGMRVLRRCDNLTAVGINILFPVASESEVNFFLPPTKSLYLTTSTEVDPFKIATPGDPDCTSIFVRSWMIDPPYMQRQQMYQFLEDGRQTLVAMQEDFPNLCDIYALAIHPIYEELQPAIGFHKTCQAPQSLLYWTYQPVDRYLALDLKQAVATLKLDLFPSDR
ncbi:hypothetical protein NDA01_22165 [Trichocoleus desertorum AS-A10]|uniref:hypothetical protein n=1 Tax=Trichocoleus desertorum TaxID=1481672 RepID=UPI003297B21D